MVILKIQTSKITIIIIAIKKVDLNDSIDSMKNGAFDKHLPASTNYYVLTPKTIPGPHNVTQPNPATTLMMNQKTLNKLQIAI